MGVLAVDVVDVVAVAVVGVEVEEEGEVHLDHGVELVRLEVPQVQKRRHFRPNADSLYFTDFTSFLSI